MIRRDLLDDYNINTDELRSESDIENKLVIPLLEDLGFERDDIHSQNTLSVRIGSQDRSLQYDTVAHVNDRPVIVIDEKAPFQGIESDILQAESYAKLLSTPPAPFAAVTDGVRWEIRNVITGEDLDDLPTKQECIDAIRTGVQELPKEEKEQAKRIAFTSTEGLIEAFENCNDPLEQPEGKTPETRFEEMAKILLTKMSEDARADEGHEHRFTWDFVEQQMEQTGFSPLQVVNEFLFADAKKRYTNVFDEDSKIDISHDETIETIIKELENYYLAGTGEDIKGPAYEIFLKEQLRQGLGKYFTPREIVFFTVELMDLNIGDKVIDPASGSGGFLTKSFTSLKVAIETSNLTETDKKKYLNDLRHEGIWGTEITPSLAELCKMNLIVHGDGHNHIYPIDGLTGTDEHGEKLIPENEFENVVTNPPFNKPIDTDSILTHFELGKGDSTGSDELFVERCIQLAKEGGTIAIVLPYGFLNLPSHEDLRSYMYENCNIKAIISLPVGAFKPVGASNSRTCVILLEKATKEENKWSDNKVFLAEAENIGYVPGEKRYKETPENDLPTIAQEYHSFRENPQEGLITENPPITGESEERLINKDRGDPSYFISKYTDYEGNEKRIDDVATVSQPKTNPSLQYPDEEFLHLSVRDIDEKTGGVRTINRKLGKDIEKSQTYFEGKQILLTRIRPSLDNKKVSIIPENITQGVGSGEFIVIEPKEDYDPYYLLQALRTDYAIDQLISKATGSTGRQRVKTGDVKETKIPWPSEEVRNKISENTKEGLELIREGKTILESSDL